ncbi:ankyrin-1-like [Chelonus insularis]|uniref:ankyrin-1-like n=1 Tax=Chelonus insularis TaxID=460826 RepID=UPI00158DD2D4|nr:ankyrin-1-like [Chelonus insularis]
MLNPRQNGDYLRLCRTIYNKDEVTTQNLILHDVDVDNDKLQRNTHLHWAIIQFEPLDVITMLLDKGADVHAMNHHHFGALKVAIQYNNVQAASLLIQRGALFREDLNSLLLMAIEQQNTPMIKILLDNGMHSNSSIDLKIPLYVAILRGQPKIIEYILPHCRFFKPSDRYFPREVIIKSGQPYKECVELLLERNFIVNPDSNRDEEFVYAAVEKGYLPIVLQLLRMGVDVNMMNPITGLNLLKVACLHEHHDIVENLLKHNAYVNVTTLTNIKILNNLLHYNRNHPLSLIHDTNDLRDITCLHIAVLNSDTKMTRLLLKYNVKIIDDPNFFYITRIAVQHNCEDIVRMFLDRGVNLDDIDFDGKSLLHFCVHSSSDEQSSRYNIAKLLLKKRAHIHIRTPGNSLLFEAIKNKYYQIAQLFLEYNADIQYVSRDGDTLLHKAIENNFDAEFIKTLLTLNSPVNAVNKDMLTPLHVACQVKLKQQLQIVKTLLDYNANVNCTVDSSTINGTADLEDFEFPSNKINIYSIDNKGQSPLHFVCKYKSHMTASIIQLLLQHNANIEAVDARGWTPLFVACCSGNDIAVKCLLDHHANINRTDIQKLTPLYIAAKNCTDDTKIVKILLKHKVNVHCMDKWGNSVIHIIVSGGNEELIKNFACTQINFNSINKQRNSPLHTAVNLPNVAVVKSLLKYGANVNILDKKNQTPLEVAIKKMIDLQNQFRHSCRNNLANEIYPYLNICKEIIKVLKIHIVKLNIAKLKVNRQNMKIAYDPNNYITSDDEFSDNDSDHENAEFNILELEVKCEQEIEQMKMNRIGVNKMTFYDLLTKNIHFLCKFVRNKIIRQILESEVYDEKFPLYIDIVRSRFRDAKFRYRMMNSASKYFTANITKRLPDNCVDTVFSYLNIKDIKMFIRAMKPLNK